MQMLTAIKATKQGLASNHITPEGWHVTTYRMKGNKTVQHIRYGDNNTEMQLVWSNEQGVEIDAVYSKQGLK